MQGLPGPAQKSGLHAATLTRRLPHGCQGGYAPKSVIQIDARARTIASKLTDVGRAPARQRKHSAGLPGREWLELIGQHLCWNDAQGKHLERAVISSMCGGGFISVGMGRHGG
jgi:hypothetical protein